MNDTIQIVIAVDDEQRRDQLIAQLSTINFDAFEEKDKELICFINADNFDAPVFDQLVALHNLTYIKTIIKEQNWNELWESNFPPVVVNNFCGIRAHFHKPFTDKQHEIVITPKMSFGTGHHATTFLMISEMSKIDFKNKKVADFGTGTGILAILAEKLGARHVWAIDIDDWSIENAKENIENNNCRNIVIEKVDDFKTDQKFDIILANINKNVIMSNVENILNGLNEFGLILLSGLLSTDEEDIVAAFIAKGCNHLTKVEKDNWISLLLQH